MKTTKGNLIDLAEEGRFDVIIHGCNCFHVMNGGIAKEIAARYPEALEVDRETTNKGDARKMGTLSVVDVGQFYIANAYTQYGYGGGGQRHTNYAALRRAFGAVREEFGNLRIGYPLIGAGLGRGDWSVISSIIEEELDGCDHTLVVLEDK